MSSPLPRLARKMTATGFVVASLGAAAALTTGTAVAATGTAAPSTSTAVTTTAGTTAAETKAYRLVNLKLSTRRSVIYPRGAALRTTPRYTRIYVKVVKRQYTQPMRVRATSPTGRPIGPWVNVTRINRTVALTNPLPNYRPFKLQWASSRAGVIKFGLYY
ncbi:hypothetical protein [Actinomadura sp. 6N118]|uniref:hypothetical protein n=1 Tax=Actinomadura sp. 6N118 TaxID=3375151 RepID=UPI00379196C4